MYTDVKTLCISLESSIHQAMSQMEISRIGIVLAVDGGERLLDTITDGDIRRTILAGINPDEPVSTLLASKAKAPFDHAISAPVEADRGALLHILQQYSISHLPLVDGEQRVVGLITLEEFVSEQEPSLGAVIMAGGLGTRMRPLTEELPKPMLPVGDRPLMEIIVEQLRDSGIKHVNVSVHHKSEKITDHFGDGSDFGVDITYVTEDRPLGTAGALGLMESPKETMLIINGDILTQIDFRAMLAYHREYRADLTMAVQRYDLQVPYGVVEFEGTFVRSLADKPTLNFFVNAGIYLLEPVACRSIPNGEPYDMTDLIQRLLDEGRSVVAFPFREYWKDIGAHIDYEQAQEYMKSLRQ